jgi:threonine synthase
MQDITGRRPGLPARLCDLMSDPERMDVLPNDQAAIERFIEARARAVSGDRA